MPGPTAFVTGAAAGIGRATARAFAADGYVVGAYDINEDGLRSLATEIEQAGGQVVTGLLDVTDPDQFRAQVDQFVVSSGGRLNVLVNNAGILAAGPFEEMPVATHHRMVDINVKGMINGMLAAFPHLEKSPNSRVVNLCSASAIYGQAELATYSATKFAVRGLTEGLDLEWGRHGIRVIAIWPAFVDTPMTIGLSTGTTRSAGINLDAGGVAKAIVAAADPAKRRLIHRVHFPVGWQSTAAWNASHFAPAWLMRLVNKRLNGV